MTTDKIAGEKKLRTAGIDYTRMHVTEYHVVSGDDKGLDFITLRPDDSSVEEHTLRRSSLSEAIRSMEPQPGYRESPQYRALRRLQIEAGDLYLKLVRQE